MEILPLENIELHGKDFDVTAKVGGKNPSLAPPAVRALVVVLDALEFEDATGYGYSTNSQAERETAGKIANDHCYLMPVADHIVGSDRLSWYGESPVLWALINPEISCKSVAFIATPTAVAYLRNKHISH